MNDDRNISIAAAFDRNLIYERGRSVRYLEVDVVAPKALPSDENAEKAPLNLALVIDASGSMAGEALECAKKAAAGVVHALAPQSRLSIVSFATTVVTHVECASVDSSARDQAVAAIEKLFPRDSTNLGAGWLRGSECLASVMEENRNMHNHVVVLSDGHANLGIVDPLVLSHHAEQLRNRGVITSAVGIGDAYSSHQLQALADLGGGQLHDAQYPHEIIEVVLGELKEVQETIVENIEVSLSFPAGVRVQNLSDFPTVIGSSSALTQIGMLAPERRRPVIFRVTAPEGSEGDKLAFEVKCSWIKTGTTERVKGTTVVRDLGFTTETSNRMQPRDLELSERVATVWQSGVVRKCVALNRQGDLKELQRYLDNELKNFSRFCEGLPGTGRLLTELRGIRKHADRRWDERMNKTMDNTSYIVQQSHNDYRTNQRGNWLDTLDNS